MDPVLMVDEEAHKLELVQWLHTQVDDRLNDEEMLSLAVEGARALDKREATYAKRKAR